MLLERKLGCQSYAGAYATSHRITQAQRDNATAKGSMPSWHLSSFLHSFLPPHSSGFLTSRSSRVPQADMSSTNPCSSEEGWATPRVYAFCLCKRTSGARTSMFVSEFRHQKPKGLTGNSLARETILAVLARDTREPWLASRPV